MEKHSSHPTLYLDTLEGRLKGDEKIDFLRFLGRMLQWLPEKKATAKELIFYTWLMHGLYKEREREISIGISGQGEFSRNWDTEEAQYLFSHNSHQQLSNPFVYAILLSRLKYIGIISFYSRGCSAAWSSACSLLRLTVNATNEVRSVHIKDITWVVSFVLIWGWDTNSR